MSYLWVMAVVGVVYAVKILCKIVVGMIAGSEMLLADGFHNFGDLADVVVIITAMTLARRRPNSRFPLGYMNIESLGSLVIGIMLGVLSLRMFLVAGAGTVALFHVAWAGKILSFVHHTESTLDPSRMPLLIAITLGSTAVSIVMSKFEIRAGKRLGSQLMVDDGKETKSDAWVEGLTFLGIMANFLTHSVAPELIVVAFLGYKLFVTSREVIVPALDTLLLRRIDDAHEEGIWEIARKSGVLNVASVRTMRVGRHMAVINMKLLVPPETTTKEQQEHKYELCRQLIRYLRGLDYLDATYEIRYGYPDEPPFAMDP